MHHKPLPEQPGSPHAPQDKSTITLLRDAVAAYSGNRMQAIRAIGRLHATDPSGLAHAALQLLVSAEEKSPGLKYAADLLMAGSLLAELFLNKDLLTLEEAVSLARKVTWVEPFLDVRLVRQVVASAAGKVGSVKNADALHVLGLVEAISDCSRLGSYLVQFLNHPSDKVRSKAALMLGRTNWNLARVESLLESDDSRLRANAVESLWGHRHAHVRKMLWNATQDPCGRVVVNALLGLCQVGDRQAYSRLFELAETSDPLLRSGAAWAMGQMRDPEFREALEKLALDDNAKVRAMAEKSRKLLPAPPHALPQPPAEADQAESTPVDPERDGTYTRGWLSGNKARR